MIIDRRDSSSEEGSELPKLRVQYIETTYHDGVESGAVADAGAVAGLPAAPSLLSVYTV